MDAVVAEERIWEAPQMTEAQTGNNPYAPPATLEPADAPLAAGRIRYVPLRGRARLAAVAIALCCLGSFLFDAALAAAADGEPGENAALALGALGGIAVWLVATVLAAVAYCVWVYAAARNLRALGAEFLQTSPGWCVGSFFVPFANLVVPYRGVREIYDASDPGPHGVAGVRRPPGWVLPLWWGTWIGAGLLGNVGARLDDPGALLAVSLVGSALLAIAGFTAVLIVNAITVGQERIRDARALQWGRDP